MDELKHRKRLDDLYLKSQKNNYLRIPILVLVFIEVANYHFQKWLHNHLCKLIFLLLVIFVLPIFGSYIFWSDGQENYISQIYNNEDNYNVIYADTKLNKDNIIINDYITSDSNDYTNSELNNYYITNDELLKSVPNIDISILTVNANVKIDDFNKDAWELVLINKQHPLPSDYQIQLESIKENMKCDKRIIDLLLLMINDASKDGVVLNVCSPYRDHNRQVMLFNKKIKNYMKDGYSYKDAYMLTAQVVTIPGSSEHEAGLSIDFNTYSYLSLDEGFENTNAGTWLKNNAYKYGFILRYPNDKEDITGIEYEPWHYRFVGVDAAYYIYSHNLCLEEFNELINK